MPERPAKSAALERPAVSRSRSPVGRGGPRWDAVTVAWFVAIVALAAVVCVFYSLHLFADSFYDLYAGRYIVHQGIPRTDVVTAASRGAPWIDQQWLAHVIYYGAWAAGGYPALAAISALLVTSGFAILALLMLWRGVPPTRMFAWTTAAIIVFLGNIVVRAQSFAYPLFALTLWLILADGRAPRLRARTALVIPVLVIWANTHGSVLIGVALTAGYAVCRAGAALWRRDGWRGPVCYLALAAASAAGVACTPYGAGVLHYYRQIDAVTPALARYVTEWQRPNPLYLVSIAFFAVALATAIAVAVAWRRGARPDPLLAVTAVALLGLALTAIRNQTWFGFAGSLLAAETLARSTGRVPSLGAGFSRVSAAVLALAALAAFGLLAVRPDGQYESLIPRRAVAAAAAVAASHPAARILGDQWASPPLLWHYPATFGRVAFDPRLEQYSPAQLGSYAAFLTARGRDWQRALRGYSIVVMSRRHGGRLAGTLTRLPGWRVVYSGRDGLVAVRAAGMRS
jgi:hypothetical protein